MLFIGNKLSSFGYTPTGIEFLSELLAREGYQVIYGGERRGQWRRLVHMLRAALNLNRYDVMLIDVYSTRAFYYSIITSLVAHVLGKPYILILRGGDLPRRLRSNPTMLRVMMSRAAKVVSVSRYLQEAFRSVREIKFIPNFIPLQKYLYKERITLRPRLLWVRSLHRIYNPELAVRVVAELVTFLPETTLTMVGPDKDGSATSVQELAKELGISDRVRLTGKLSKEEWIRLAEESDIFINTTNFDNMPVSVVEAMALGLPVVSTNVGGVPFLIEHGKDGLLVDQNDVDGFVQSILNLVANPEWGKELANHARQKAETFDEHQVVYQWRTLLESIEWNDR